MSKILFFVLLISISSRTIFLPFKRNFFEELNSTNLMSQLYENNIYIILKVGTPIQEVPLYLKLNQYPSFILTRNENAKFNENKSSTFQFLEKSYSLYHFYDFFHGILSSDKIQFDNNNIIDNYTFILSKKLIDKNMKFSGEIGLDIQSKYPDKIDITNFIDQLKKINFTDNYSFSLKYTNQDEGFFIFGNYLHNYDKKYNENDFLFDKLSYYKNNMIKWSFSFDELYSGNQILKFEDENKTLAELSYELGLIIGSTNYFYYIQNNFLNNNFCIKQKLKGQLYLIYYECPENINIKQFPEIKFVNKNLKFNFTLNYNDLFLKYDNKYYFLIVFSEVYQGFFTFGAPFLRKYQIFLDKDKKIFGIYPQKENKQFNLLTYALIFISLLIIFIFIIIIFVKSFSNKNLKRKLRANELNYDYEYAETIN